MMKIAICDDCIEDIKTLEKMILRNTEFDQKAEFGEFLNGETMLDRYEAYDVIFFDILMKGKKEGTEIAENIRSRDEDVLLVYYTAYDYPASSICTTNPFRYLIKDACPQKTEAELRKILKEAEKRQKLPCLTVANKGKKFVLRPQEILYIAILNKGTAIYPTQEKTAEICKMLNQENVPREYFLKSAERLDQYYEQLKDYGFVYGKKSYIINVCYITARMKDAVRLQDETILSIARSRKKEFDDQYSRYWRMQGQ